MTESVRHGDFSAASSGMAFRVDEDGPPSPEQRVDEWDGDHVRKTEQLDADLDSEADDEPGIDPSELTDEDLFRDLGSLHRTRLDTLRHGADTALGTHLRRTAELETEYLTRYPEREIDPHRLRDGH